MIQSRMEWQGRRFVFVAEGHAGYAPTGQDIVCAAVSMLAQTLVDATLESAEDVEEVHACALKPGYARFDMTATQRGRERTATRFDMVASGMELLQNSYPAQVIFHSDRGEIPRKG